jgi:ABC-type lipoprotein export system ATPase subunit
MSTPCVVFLDEPTSGLDSFAALSVMSYMRGMATAGSQTVVSSIHQPRAAIWALFDKVSELLCVCEREIMNLGYQCGCVGVWVCAQAGG